jgi:hypothetical protein
MSDIFDHAGDAGQFPLGMHSAGMEVEPATPICKHRRIKPGSYADTWKTDCGQTYKIEGPIEVGMGFNPDPSGNFCSNCGKKLVVVRYPKTSVEDEDG